MTGMQHRHLFVNSLLPHLKYPLRQQKSQSQAEALQAALQNGGESVPQDRSIYRGVEGGYEESYLSTQSE
jgi:hypothetical protein